MTISYRLVRPEVRGDLELTEAQQRVADHRQGALLVLGGVRTGKTTSLVEATVGCLGAGASQALFLTGSRASRLAVRARIGSTHPELASRVRVTTFYSFAQWVVQRFGDQSQVPSVLTAARQDTYIREILAGQPEDAWPGRFAHARRTVKFAADVREAVATCQRGGLNPEDVMESGVRAGREEWVALGRFYQEYLDILGMAGVLDYAEFLIRAVGLLRDPDVLACVRPPGSLVVVDEVEDMDPSQEEIVNCLVDQGSTIIAAANPDCQVYGFRGAKPRSVGEMMSAWGERGISTQVVCLEKGYDVSSAVEDRCSDLKRRIPLPVGIGVEDLNAYRHMAADREGEVTKILFTDADSEADHIAQILVRAHVADGIGYDEMAVLVRQRGDFARYASACEGLGVPVAVSGDEIQLNQEKIVDVLLAGLRIVRDGERCSPLDLDVVADSPFASAEVRGAGEAKRSGSVAEVLWAMWEASGWQESLMAEVERDGGDGLRANRALDAVVALFSLASTYSDMAADKGISAVNEAVASQEVPENLPRSSSWASSAVRLTTAHRAKGHCWSLVVVAGIEEAVWPPRSAQTPILDVEGLSAHFSPASGPQMMAAERRLLYAACSSCSDRLILTAVGDEDATPSLFFEQIPGPVRVVGASVRTPPLSAAGLVGHLRSVAADESAHPGLRQAASVRLADLCGNPYFHGAHPSRWWGACEDPNRVDECERQDGGRAQLDGASTRPVGGPARTVTLSASQVESLFSCPRRWYLARRVQADPPATARTRIGSVIHGLVQNPSASLEEMTQGLEEVWDEMEFPANWMKDTELEDAKKALARFESYRRATGREVVASEASVDFEVDCAGPVRVQGRIDRIERDQLGRIWIVDLKTGKRAPTSVEAKANVQLGLYQLALEQPQNVLPTPPVVLTESGSPYTDAVLPTAGSPYPCAGAELVYLRNDNKKGSDFPKVLAQESLHDTPHLAKEPPLTILTGDLLDEVGDQWQYPTWVHHRIALASALIRRGDYPALSGSGCRYCAFKHSCPVIEARGGRK